MIQKQVLSPNRVRHLPRSDWSWVDRRFLRQFSSRLSGDAVFLYFILVAVSDKNGLSYYSDDALALRIRTSLTALAKARQELLDLDLIAWHSPLVQVLSLPCDQPSPPRGALKPPATGATEIQMLLAAFAQKSSISHGNGPS